MNQSRKINKVVFLILTIFNFCAFLFCVVIEAKFLSMQFFFFFLSMFLPIIISFISNIKIEPFMQLTYEIFLILHFVFGEMLSFYVKYMHYDTMLHFISAILLSILGYSIIHYYLDEKLIFLQLLFAIIFSMSLEYTWEILEFTIDHFCNTNMQRFIKDNLILTGHIALFDTIKDMMIGFIGSLTIVFLINIKPIKKIKIKVYEKRKQVF